MRFYAALPGFVIVIFVTLIELPPHTLVRMPALSPTMTSGNIGTWKKKIGDEIVPGDVLVEIETDKAQMDLECQDDGYLAKIFVVDGTSDVDINTVIYFCSNPIHV